MKKILFPVFAFIFAACSTITLTPRMTVSPPATLIPTQTPTASATPTPTEAPLPEGIKALQEKLAETDYSVGRSKENKEQLALFYTDEKGKKVEVPEITVNSDGSWTRAYNLPDIEEKFVVEGTMAEIEIILDKDGTKNLGLYNWKVEDGELTRKTAEFATKIEGETVELELTTVEEVQFEILNNSSTNPIDRADTVENLNRLVDSLFDRELRDNSFFQFGGMYEPNFGTRIWADNIIVLGNNPINTAEFIVAAIGQTGDYGLIGWTDASGDGQVRIVDKEKLNVHSNFNNYYLTHKP